MPLRTSFFKQCDVEWPRQKHSGSGWRGVHSCAIYPSDCLWHSRTSPAPLSRNWHHHKFNLWLIKYICLELKPVCHAYTQWEKHILGKVLGTELDIAESGTCCVQSRKATITSKKNPSIWFLSPLILYSRRWSLSQLSRGEHGMDLGLVAGSSQGQCKVTNDHSHLRKI